MQRAAEHSQNGGVSVTAKQAHTKPVIGNALNSGTMTHHELL